MSILKGAFSDAEAGKGTMEFAARMLEKMLPKLDENARRIVESMGRTGSLGDALGVTDEQKAALLDLGCRLIQYGKPDDAFAILLRLVQLDPLEERAAYALGVVFQLRGELRKAAQMFMYFLTLDATNPTGYLRLGECLLRAREYGEAYNAFMTAKELADEGKGQPGNSAEAARMLALPEMIAAGGLKHHRHFQVQ